MTVSCAIVLSSSSYQAGQTPPPTATLVCQNNTNAAQVVIGVQVTGRVFGSSTPGNPAPMGTPMPPYGPGAPVTVPALGSASIGPFPLAVGSAAATVGGNSQPSQVANYILMVGANVLTADQQNSVAAEMGMTVGPTTRPLPNAQGGYLLFSQPSNSALWFF